MFIYCAFLTSSLTDIFDSLMFPCIVINRARVAFAAAARQARGKQQNNERKVVLSSSLLHTAPSVCTAVLYEYVFLSCPPDHDDDNFFTRVWVLLIVMA